MKAKILCGAILVVILLSSSVSATPTAGFYGVNSISTFLNRYAIRIIERFYVEEKTVKDGWAETGNLLGGDADDYANGCMPDKGKGNINDISSGQDGFDTGLDNFSN
ncbi:MAG: hypothetical protein U5O15_06225 [Candidatus Krumholzibacteriota bacterium]|nr:hypothetical protein [Candidatus Krumholzibacteriota bacterium]